MSDQRDDPRREPLSITIAEVDLSLWKGDRAMGVVAPLEIRTKAQQVVERLVTAVALGSIAPGQRFPPERELAQRLHVSRVTLRAALHELQTRGYVTISKGRLGGATVTSSWQAPSAGMIRRTLIPLWERLEMLFDLDRGLGQLVARLAAERRSSSDLEKIQEHVAAYASPDSDRDVRDQSDRAIHAGIAEATHNPYLVSLQNQIWTELSLGTGNLPGSRRLHEQAVIDHQALSDALAARNGKLAAQINLRHFAELVEIPLRQLRERILEQGAPSESDDALATPEVGTT